MLDESEFVKHKASSYPQKFLRVILPDEKPRPFPQAIVYMKTALDTTSKHRKARFIIISMVRGDDTEDSVY